MCILENINILRNLLYFKVIALHFIMQRQEFEGMATCAHRFKVDEKRLWRDVSVERSRVSEFLHLRILNDGADELRSL